MINQSSSTLKILTTICQGVLHDVHQDTDDQTAIYLTLVFLKALCCIRALAMAMISTFHGYMENHCV